MLVDGVCLHSQLNDLLLLRPGAHGLVNGSKIP